VALRQRLGRAKVQAPVLAVEDLTHFTPLHRLLFIFEFFRASFEPNRFSVFAA
jgi:hypothetical protein